MTRDCRFSEVILVLHCCKLSFLVYTFCIFRPTSPHFRFLAVRFEQSLDLRSCSDCHHLFICFGHSAILRPLSPSVLLVGLFCLHRSTAEFQLSSDFFAMLEETYFSILSSYLQNGLHSAISLRRSDNLH